MSTRRSQLGRHDVHEDEGDPADAAETTTTATTRYTKFLDLTNGEGGGTFTTVVSLPPPPAPVATDTTGASTEDDGAAADIAEAGAESAPYQDGEEEAGEDYDQDQQSGDMEGEGEDDEDDEDDGYHQGHPHSTTDGDDVHVHYHPDTLQATSGSGGGGSFRKRVGGMELDPNTPGRLVDSGQEHTGRWTKEEHEAFLAALQMYGKEWKKVAAKVKTRTVVQTRTHAQKYFQKLQKTISATGKEDLTHVDMGVATDPPMKRSEQQQQGQSKKKMRTAGSPASGPISSTSSSPTTSANVAANPGSSDVMPPKFNRRSSNATLSAAQVISNLSQAAPGAFGVGTGHSMVVTGSSTTLTSSSSLHVAPPKSSLTVGSSIVGATPPPRHGFSTDLTTTVSGSIATGSTESSASSSAMNRLASSGMTWTAARGMKITAPDPGAAMRRGQFPEPSPAATGKRKLAEIAAARMLAGVAGVPTPSVAASNTEVNRRPAGSAFGNTSSQLPPPQSLQSGAMAISETMLMDNEESDGPPTPPPADGGLAVSCMLNLKDAPVPPIFVAGSFVSDSVGGCDGMAARPLTLQIVNPETLGVSYQQRRGGRGGGDSPVTPWDGQLEALVASTCNKITSDRNALDDDGGENGTDAGAGVAMTTTISNGHAMAAVDKAAQGVSGGLHAVSDPSLTQGRTPLHQAVCDMDLDTVEQCLANNHDGTAPAVDTRDDAGYAPLHSACSLGMVDPSHCELSESIVRVLLSHGANPTLGDSNGNTPLHWAARAGHASVIMLLLDKYAVLDVRNHANETPLHWAMRAGSRGMDVVTILLDSGARCSLLDKYRKRAIDVAAEGFTDEEGSVAQLRKRDFLSQQQQSQKKPSRELKKAIKDTSADRRACRTHFFLHSTQSRTLVLHHAECLEHVPKSSADWEAPDRVISIMGKIRPDEWDGPNNNNGNHRILLPHEVTVSSDFERAKLDLLSRVHSTEYLAFVNQLSKDLEKQIKDATAAAATAKSCTEDPADKNEFPTSLSSSSSPPVVVPFTPMVQKSMVKFASSVNKLGVNSDTSFSAGSLRAARRAAGAVQHAVDCVLLGRNRNAFCVVRPPGHHAGVDGLLEGGESCGFCIFNNVAAGALYAVSDDKALCERCAIVDIDVHHGNGTEEIVRRSHDPSRLFFFSIHLYDNDKRKRSPNQFAYKFYPGTGSEDDLALNIINVPIVPLWKDLAAQAAAPKTHNTRHKARSQAAQHHQQHESPSGTTASITGINCDDSSDAGTPRENNSEAGSERGSSGAPNANNPATCNAGRAAYRQAITHRLLPALRAFNPDLILISAGFDAAAGDVGNARHERGGVQRIGLDLTPDDYAWTTRQICQIADLCCQGRVVSVLEGGYGRSPAPGPAPLVGEDGLDRTGFAECAARHLHAMIDPYDIEGRFSTS